MSESTYQIIIAIGILVPIVGGMLTAAFRALGWMRAAAVVEAVQPLALRAAHEAATRPPSAPPKPPSQPPAAPPGLLTMCLALGLALAVTGCGAGADVLRAAQLSSEVIARAEPCLVAQYEAEQRTCLELPTDERRRACVGRVREEFAPVVDGLDELRRLRCGLEPQKCEASR